MAEDILAAAFLAVFALTAATAIPLILRAARRRAALAERARQLHAARLAERRGSRLTPAQYQVLREHYLRSYAESGDPAVIRRLEALETLR